MLQASDLQVDVNTHLLGILYDLRHVRLLP